MNVLINVTDWSVLNKIDRMNGMLNIIIILSFIIIMTDR